MMTEFERGVRFVLERTETYTKGQGPRELQYGDYMLSMVPRPASELTKGSADHREKRVQSILFIALNEAGNTLR